MDQCGNTTELSAFREHMSLRYAYVVTALHYNVRDLGPLIEQGSEKILLSQLLPLHPVMSSKKSLINIGVLNFCFKFGCRVFEHVGCLNLLHPPVFL